MTMIGVAAQATAARNNVHRKITRPIQISLFSTPRLVALLS